MLVGFEHVGMTVSNMDAAVHFYCDLLGLRLHLRKPNGSGEVAFFDSGAGMLEVFCPGSGPVDRFRDVPSGEAGMRHMAFAFADVDAMFETLVAAGIEPVEKPRDAFNREVVRRVAFVRDPDGILVELLERAPGR
jgi:glyoxylase I family protein